VSDVTKERILEVLNTVHTGTGGGSVVAKGWVKDVVIKDGHVAFALEVPPDLGPSLEPVRARAEKAVHDLPGVLSATVVLTAEKPSTPPQQTKAAGREQLALPGIKSIVAVASGKGGVGKSTTSANLAVALAQQGLSVALFDADIFGPSMPRMLGLAGQKPHSDGSKVYPLENHGVKVMSIGFMVAEDNPVIWRGPMVMGALEQMLKDVAWGDIDVMVVDMPPGTGDTQLTMSQRVPLAGAVIVSTPQDIALLDARKGLNMFRRVEVPILGIIENMSHYICPSCGHRDEIFGHGGAKRTAEELSADFLGEIPLDLKIRETSDGGTPITVADPNSPHAAAYRAIAQQIMEKLAAGGRKGPNISMG
jgi:ATP-binding protein involved in chromosome partitioning